MTNIQSSNKKSASKNNTSTSRSTKGRSNKINNKSRMVGGGDCGYTYTPTNGPCLGPHPANIVTPSCSTATAPVSGDISSSAGLYMTQSGGGSKSNLKFSSNKNQNITDGMISLYSSLYGGSSGVLNKNNRVPLYHAMEIKSRYGNKNEYSHIGGGVFKGNVSQYKKILKSNLEKIRTMTSGGGKINVNNLNKDILVRFVGNKKSQTGGRVSFPIEYYGGDSGNYSAGNASSGGGVPVPRGSSGVVQTGGRVSFPIEYYGGDSGNYSAGNGNAGGNVPVPRGSSGVDQTGGRVSFPIEYYGGDSGNYSAGGKVLDWNMSSLTSNLSGQVGGGKIPVIDHPIYGNILKTVGILSISPDMLVPLSVLVFAYELFLKKKYGSVINDPVLDKTLKGVGILSMHPLGLVPLGLITTQTLLKRSIAKNKAKRAIIGKYVNKSKSNKGSKGSKGSKGKK